MHHATQRSPPPPPMRQRGASLITVMLILIVVSGLGIGAVQISIMGERSARNDRDMQVAWQATEAGLMDAQFDIQGNKDAKGGTRSAIFGSAPSDLPMVGMFSASCDNTGDARGLCSAADVPALGAPPAQPAWLRAEFTSANTPSVEFGTFTGAKYPNSADKGGVRSARAPRYLIELHVPHHVHGIWPARRHPSRGTDAVAPLTLRVPT
jgi:type IV pilus assembly protein PilX